MQTSRVFLAPLPSTGSIRLLRVGLGIATFSAQLAVDVKTSVMVKLLQKHSRQGKHELEISDRMRALHLVEEKNFTNILSDFERCALINFVLHDATHAFSSSSMLRV